MNYDKIIDQLEDDLANELITEEEYKQEMRNLKWEIEEAAQQAYDEVLENF